jgi:hypothetical protein
MEEINGAVLGDDSDQGGLMQADSQPKLKKVQPPRRQNLNAAEI